MQYSTAKHTLKSCGRTLIVDGDGENAAAVAEVDALGQLLEAVGHLGRRRALDDDQVVLVHQATVAQQRRHAVVRRLRRRR